MWRVHFSRALNRFLFGGQHNEMLSSRIHRERWACEKFVDKFFFFHKNHCLKCHKWERRYNEQEETR